MKKTGLLLKIAVIAVLTIGTVVLLLNAHVMLSTEDKISDTQGEKYSCILVLGAGIRPDGSPSHMLEDRIIKAVELYKSGVSDVIVMSGDHSSESYNEVKVMKNHAISLGVPESAIICDGRGYSTYESVWRTKEVLGYSSFIIVTQNYHLYRALYIAESLDIKCAGASASLRKYGGQFFNDLREAMARCKDFVFTIAKPEYR